MRHEHTWLPRPDLGRARYGCPCGAHGRKRVSLGLIEECPELPPERTVDFKPVGPRPQDMDQRPILSRTHSTRAGSTPIQMKFLNFLRESSADWAPLRQLKRGERDRERGDSALIRAAWFEWQVSWSFRTGLPPMGGDPPGWFVREELGFSAEHRPSLADTCRNLADLNRRAIQRLDAVGGLDSPERVTYPLNFKIRSHRNGRKRS